jgi:hypothetical protein
MHSLRTRHARFLGVTACVFALGLAACGGSSKAASSSTATTGAGGSTAALAPASDTSGGGSGRTTCNQVTKADVQALLTSQITTVTVKAAGMGPDLQPDGKGQQCIFATSDTSNAISIMVLPANDLGQNYDGDVRSLSQPVNVAGVGDKAVRDGAHATSTLSSVKGNVYCAVSVQSDDVPGIAQLEDAAGHSSNIGDKAFSELADAIGTLCNRVYGSGNTTPDLTGLKAAGAAAASQPTTTTALTVPANFTLPTDGSTTP